MLPSAIAVVVVLLAFAAGTPVSKAADDGTEPGMLLAQARSAASGRSSALAGLSQSMSPGWREIPNTRFRDVMPAQARTEWGTIGPIGVLLAWNNIAFDGEALYAQGGGHADYGGNEAYRFSLSSLKWERITEPARYPERKLADPDGSPTPQNSPLRCPPPVSGPPSSHTYDGKFVTAGKLWIGTTGIAYCPSGTGEITHAALWGFDLATKQWSKAEAPLQGLWLSAVLPDGNVFIANSGAEIIYDPRTGNTVQRQDRYPDEGDGSAVYDAKRNLIWIANRATMAYVPLTPEFKFAGRRIRVLPKRFGDSAHLGGVGFDGATAVDPVSGRLIRWGGRKHVVAYTPEIDKWEAYDFPTGPTSRGALYDRIFSLPGHDGVFIAVSNNVDENVWLLKLPKDPGTPVATGSLQTTIDRAAIGSRVQFAPGFYNTGVLITKPIIADFTGVTIAAPVESKAAVVVRDAKGVVVENLTACGLPSGGNVAAIKAEGSFELTIRHLVSCDNEMGLLTDNKGGRLVIEDSLFENMGRAGADLGHLVYAGEIDELVLRHSVMRCSRNGGHLVKSRAQRSVIDRNVIAQTDCDTSRLIDLPAGGENVVRNNVLQQGPGSQNAEMIGTALEMRSRQWQSQTTLIEDNLFISDLKHRPGSSIPAVYKTREGHIVTARGNRIVWTDGDALRGKLGYLPGGTFAEVGRANKEFIGRAAAGLPPYPALVEAR